MKTISVGFLVYNDKDFLEIALNSLINQTLRPIEIIVADDASTDGSEKICRDYANKYSSINYVRHDKNIGISKNMEFVLSIAKGDYFAWMADDDIWEPNFLEILSNKLSENSDNIVAFCDYYIIDDNNAILHNRKSDYSAQNYNKQINKLIEYKDDIFGYGLFVRNKILDVKFPVWKWPNQKVAYNNIYPSLFYYLSNGKYIHENVPLFSNRVKSKINHVNSYNEYFIWGFISYSLRRMNLFIEITRSLNLRNLNTPYKLIFSVFYQWIALDIFNYFKHRLKFFYKFKIG